MKQDEFCNKVAEMLEVDHNFDKVERRSDRRIKVTCYDGTVYDVCLVQRASGRGAPIP